MQRGPVVPRHSKTTENVLGSLGWAPEAQILNMSLPGPALSLPSQDTYSDSALPCFLLPTRDIWFPASLPGRFKTSSSWDISCFPPSSLLKIAIGVNTGRHMELQPPLTEHQRGPVASEQREAACDSCTVQLPTPEALLSAQLPGKGADLLAPSLSSRDRSQKSSRV